VRQVYGEQAKGNELSAMLVKHLSAVLDGARRKALETLQTDPAESFELGREAVALAHSPKERFLNAVLSCLTALICRSQTKVLSCWAAVRNVRGADVRVRQRCSTRCSSSTAAAICGRRSAA
jgi:hypothetical protein